MIDSEELERVKRFEYLKTLVEAGVDGVMRPGGGWYWPVKLDDDE